MSVALRDFDVLFKFMARLSALFWIPHVLEIETGIEGLIDLFRFLNWNFAIHH